MAEGCVSWEGLTSTSKCSLDSYLILIVLGQLKHSTRYGSIPF